MIYDRQVLEAHTRQAHHAVAQPVGVDKCLDFVKIFGVVAYEHEFHLFVVDVGKGLYCKKCVFALLHCAHTHYEVVRQVIF